MLKCDPRAWARCPDRKVCASCSEDACFAEGSDCHRYNLETVAQPMTNADRIRAMSDEELAEVIYKRIGGELTCGNLPQCKDDVDNDREIPDKRCIGCVLSWLRQPVEVADG